MTVPQLMRQSTQIRLTMRHATPADDRLLAETSAGIARCARIKAVAMPDASADGVSGIAELMRLYSRMPWIGHGVRMAALNACLSSGARAPCAIMCPSIWERHRRAIRFCENAGFTAVGEQIYQPGSDAQGDLIMARPITPIQAFST